MKEDTRQQIWSSKEEHGGCGKAPQAHKDARQRQLMGVYTPVANRMNE